MAKEKQDKADKKIEEPPVVQVEQVDPIQQERSRQALNSLVAGSTGGVNVNPNQAINDPNAVRATAPPPDLRQNVIQETPNTQVAVNQEPTQQGIFNTPPPPVKEAEETKGAGFWKTLLKYATSPLPIVAYAGRIPHDKAVAEQKRIEQRDDEISDMFFKAVDDDPVFAKQLSRTQSVRDALQRNYRMSGEQILDLDKSITEEGTLSRKDMLKNIMATGRGPEGGFKTEYGTMTTPRSVKIVNGAAVDAETGELRYDVNQQRMDSQTNRLMENNPKLTYEDAWILAGGAGPNAAQKRFTITKVGDTGVIIHDQLSNTERKVNMAEAKQRKNFAFEAIDLNGDTIPDAFGIHNPYAATPEDLHMSALKFEDINLGDGTTLASRKAEAIRQGELRDKGGVMSWLLSYLPDWNITDNQPDPPATASPITQQGPPAQIKQQNAPTPVTAPPVQAGSQQPQVQEQVDPNEQAKFDSFYSDFIGD